MTKAIAAFTGVFLLCLGLRLDVGVDVAKAVEPEIPQEQPVAALIARLSDPDPDVRETADDTLYDLPPTAFPFLEQAAQRKDLPAEATQRLQRSVGIQSPLQDARLRRWQEQRASYVFNENAVLTAYQDAGKHDPKWDALATDALKAIVCPGNLPLSATARQRLEKAIAAGCDDPLILYFSARMMVMNRLSPETFALMKRAADALHQSKYPMSRKLFADIRLLYANRTLHPGPIDAAMEPYLDSAVSEFAQACKEPNIPREWVYEWAHDLTASMLAAGIGRKDAFDQIEPAMEEALPNASEPLVIKGEFYVDYAWDARGTGWANSVTDKGWQLMSARLSIAEEALGKAWAIDPHDEKSAVEMLSVELGQGQGKPRMEKWFSLAMQADPDDFDACRAKMYYLEPKWFGSEEEMLAFARECGRTRRWSSRLPLLICDAHEDLLGGAADQNAYRAQPRVWADVSTAYTRYLRQYADDIYIRNQYALWAWQCHHPDVVNAQLNILGDQADPQVFGGATNLQHLKQDLARRFPPTSPTTSPTTSP